MLTQFLLPPVLDWRSLQLSINQLGCIELRELAAILIILFRGLAFAALAYLQVVLEGAQAVELHQLEATPLAPGVENPSWRLSLRRRHPLLMRQILADGE